jgi:hypothetical protein
MWKRILSTCYHISNELKAEYVIYYRDLISQVLKTFTIETPKKKKNMICFKTEILVTRNINSVTCQPIVGSRNRALLGSRLLNASWPNTHYATTGEAVSSPCRAKPHRVLLHIRPRWRHTASCSFLRQRRCKHGDLTQQSWLAPFFVLLVLAIWAKRLAVLVQFSRGVLRSEFAE